MLVKIAGYDCIGHNMLREPSAIPSLMISLNTHSLLSQFMAAFKKLGMVEYVARNGSYFESHMHSKVGEEYNDKISRNYVITGIKPGLKARDATECYGCICI